jgi:hypothetical protein
LADTPESVEKMMGSFLARTVPVAAILIALMTFGKTGAVVAVLTLLVGMVVWAALHRSPAAIVEYDFAD